MKRLIIILPIMLLAACSKNVICMDESPACGVVNGVKLVTDIVINTPSSKKCHEMTGEKKQRCIEQVEAVKAAIARQNKQ